MFYDVYEFAGTLVVRLKEGVDLDSSTVKEAVYKLLKENCLRVALVFDYDKKTSKDVHSPSEEDFQELMTQNVSLGGRSKKSRMIASEMINND